MRKGIWILLLVTALLLSGCAMQTVDQMYCPPKRSPEHSGLQAAIDGAMAGLSYCTPTSGENQQTVQMADLNGDGIQEYLVFAKSASDTPLRILIFQKSGEAYLLHTTVECLGSGFEQVEYVDMDGSPGVELVVGRRVSEQVLGAVSVYSFASGEAQQLMSANYHKFLSCDLNRDGQSELLLLHPGQSDADRGNAVLYSFRDGQMERSQEVELSEPAACIKRIMPGALHGGIPAVYVASSADGSAIVTDIFALKNGEFTNISFSNESGTSVQTLRNYFVYADDIDEDGVLELPSLITAGSTQSSQQEYLIRWFAMDIQGREVDKLYTFHNYGSGWYLELNSIWAEDISVSREGVSYIFSIWDPEQEKQEAIFRVISLTGDDREAEASQNNRFPLYRTDSVVYAAKLEAASAAYGITEDYLITCFRLIHQDWKTGET